jgi:hypothetical protein
MCGLNILINQARVDKSVYRSSSEDACEGELLPGTARDHEVVLQREVSLAADEIRIPGSRPLAAPRNDQRIEVIGFMESMH